MINLQSAFHFSKTPALAAADTYELPWIPQPDIPYFQGHFPGQPMLPAVAIIDANLLLLEKILGKSLRLQKLVTAKFALPIQPQMKILIRLKKKVGSDQIWLCDWLENQTEPAPKTLAHMTVVVADV